jgi:peptide/nickel transport system permease protein
MFQYLIRRFLQGFLTLVVISVVVFALASAYPGGIMSAYEENPDVTAEDYARLRAKYGLDDPVPVRYMKWLGSVVTGDWGTSFVSKRPVVDEINDRLWNTLLLMGTALIVTLVIAVPMGVITALRQYSTLDNSLTAAAFAGNSLPVFWFGLLLIMVFHVWLGWFPGSGMSTLGKPFSIPDLLWHMALPVTMLALVTAAGYMRYMRSSMLDVIGQDYMRTARAKGLSERTVNVRHGLRNALIPLVTLLAFEIPLLFGGALYTETIFAWPGMGRLFYERAVKGDIPVVMALVIIFSALTILAMFLADVAYTILDPRIKLGKSKAQ